MAFSSVLRDVFDDVSKQLKAKEHNETAEYILLYGKYEAIAEDLDSPLKTILRSREFSFGCKGDELDQSSYIEQYHELYRQILDSFLKFREPVGQVLLKNLKKFAAGDPKPDTEFNLFARHCVQHVLDLCHHELKLAEKFFAGGPILAEYPAQASWNAAGGYEEKLEQNRSVHIKSLHVFLTPYLSNGDLHRVCDLVNWLENIYLAPLEGSEDSDTPQEYRRAAHVLLNDHLWPLSDILFIKAAAEIEHFKPTADDLRITTDEMIKTKGSKNDDLKVKIVGDSQTTAGSTISSAYPTVKTAVGLLVMYNDSMYDRPVSSVVKISENTSINI